MKLYEKFKKGMCTYIIIFVCILAYILKLYFKYTTTGDAQSVEILLGAHYKTFVLTYNEFYRLITYSFIHNSIIHLAFNMYSLYIIGTSIEEEFGHIKFILFYFIGALFGSLTTGVLINNSIEVGASGAIYCLFAIFFLYYFKNVKEINRISLYMLLAVEIGINFIPGISWTCHLGGVIAGLLIFAIETSMKKEVTINTQTNIIEKVRNKLTLNTYLLTLLLLVSVFVLGYKYIKSKDKLQLYGGTDSNYISYVYQLGNLDKAAYYAEIYMNEYLKGE